MNTPKPFQQATINAAVRALADRHGSRRFLVADEVGLGKTIVAQHVIHRMMASKAPLTVFYICNSQAIARQNVVKLLQVLDESERDQARCTVDRLSLMREGTVTHPRLRLFSLTPKTSLPSQKGRPRKGLWAERALLQHLTKKICPELLSQDPELFICGVKDWSAKLGYASRHYLKTTSAQSQWFESALRLEFFGDPDASENLASRLCGEWAASGSLSLIARMRNALAVQALDDIRPDLVIFDEFQRFQELLRPVELVTDGDNDAATRILVKLRGDHATSRPGLLLLSATPYRLLTGRQERERGGHHGEFFEVLEFLAGHGEEGAKLSAECRVLFDVLRQSMLSGDLDTPAALLAREQLAARFVTLVARTERASHDGWWRMLQSSESQTRPWPAPITPEALDLFKHLICCFDRQDRTATIPYWTSIPMPMQSIGSDYVAYRRAERNMPAPVKGMLTWSQCRRYFKPGTWPHPRMAALATLMPPQRLALPWTPPSRPWWPLQGAWKKSRSDSGEVPHKLLLFSRFRAVPTTVAALLSYEMEQWVFKNTGVTYDKRPGRHLSPQDGRHKVLALFHASPWLVRNTDPRRCSATTRARIRKQVESQILVGLKKSGIRVTKGKRNKQSRMPTWKLLARLDSAPWVQQAWRRQDKSQQGGVLTRLLDDWCSEATYPLHEVSKRDIRELADWAVTAPGVVLGRSLFRYWPEAITEAGMSATLAASWHGLRTYLDDPCFVAGLSRHGEQQYPRALRQATFAGNLESVLDEHLWITRKLHERSGQELAQELQGLLSLRSVDKTFSQWSEKSSFRLRCHAALPFTDVQVRIREDDTQRAEDKKLRANELRKAFNSPFWPHVLATTSVGQEGLDFHVWCRALLHWDLPSNAVDLEQREGRIQRYGGLAIRRAMASGVEDLPRDGSSPWPELADRAEEGLGDESGLAPWWVCEGARILRYVFDVPLSEQAHKLRLLQDQRLKYRMVLGQPDQEDLLELLADVSPEKARSSALNLSPWFMDNDDRKGKSRDGNHLGFESDINIDN